MKRYALQATLDLVNQQNPAIQFTVEVEKDGKLRMPFLDAEIERQGAHLSMTVYRKPTLSDCYLNFESHHLVTAKCSTVDALFSRAEAIVTNEEQKQAEFSKIKQELLANDYPASFIDNRLTRIKQRKTEESARSRDAEAEDQRRQTTVTIYRWSNQAPAEILETFECKSSWKAKKLEVVAPAAAERSDQSRG